MRYSLRPHPVIWYALARECMNKRIVMIKAVACMSLSLVVGDVGASDWPGLGGADMRFISPESGLARAWPATGPRVLWSVALGDGFAGPAVKDGLVYLLDRPDETNDVLRCWTLESGIEQWHFSYDAPGKLPFNGSRNVPTIEGEFIFMVGPFGHIACVNRRTHQPSWRHHLVDDFKDPKIDRSEPAMNREDTLARTQLPMWGMTQAPLLYKDTVIVGPQTKTVGLVAYDKVSGKIRWQSGYLGRNWYSHVSPCLAQFGGVDQIIMLAQPSDPEKSPAQAPPAIISATDAKTGQILWTTHTPAPYKIPIPQPIPIGSDRLFITGGYGLGSLMLQVGYSNGVWQPRVAWHNQNAAGHIHSPVLFQDRLHVMSFKEHGGRNTGLVCLDLEGSTLWQTGPALQFDSGSLIVAGGLALIMHGKTGRLYLFDLSATGAHLLSEAKVLDGRDPWAPMALANGRLLVRDQNHMKCLDLRP
jgi:outer membrane protein assembly factor BamB